MTHLVSGGADRVRVCIEAEEEGVVWHRLGERMYRGEHRQRREPVGIAMERGQEVLSAHYVLCAEDEEVAVCDGHRLVESGHHLTAGGPRRYGQIWAGDGDMGR